MNLLRMKADRNAAGLATMERPAMQRPAAERSPIECSTRRTLRDVPVGQAAVIKSYQDAGQGRRQQARRLAELGLRPGVEVTIVQKTSGGGRVIKLGQSRYALDATVLAKFPVEA